MGAATCVAEEDPCSIFMDKEVRAIYLNRDPFFWGIGIAAQKLYILNSSAVSEKSFNQKHSLKFLIRDAGGAKSSRQFEWAKLS